MRSVSSKYVSYVLACLVKIFNGWALKGFVFDIKVVKNVKIIKVLDFFEVVEM